MDTDDRSRQARRCCHAACGCTVRGDEACSVYCDNVEHAGTVGHTELATEDGACACGHDACEASQRVPENPETVKTAIGGP